MLGYNYFCLVFLLLWGAATSGNMRYHMTLMIICNGILEGRSIGLRYGGVVYVIVFLQGGLKIKKTCTLQVTQKLPKLCEQKD